MTDQWSPGWYPQPNGEERYWDGNGWTGYVRGTPSAPGFAPQTPSATPPTSDLPVYGAQQNRPDFPAYQQPNPAAGFPPAQVPGNQLVPQQMVVAPKSPAVSLVLSFFFPGVGSMVNGDVGIGILILAGYLICWGLSWLFVPLIGVFGFWVWGMVHAYQGAQRWNLRHGILS